MDGSYVAGTSSDLAAALTASFTATTFGARISITNNDYTTAELKLLMLLLQVKLFYILLIQLYLVLQVLSVALSGTINYTGAVTITNADYTVAQLKLINNGTSGNITFSTPGTALSDTAQI